MTLGATAVSGGVLARLPDVESHTPIAPTPPSHLIRVARTPARPSGIKPPEDSVDDWRLAWVDDFETEALHKRWRVYSATRSTGVTWKPSHVKQTESMAVLETYQDPVFGNQWISGGMSVEPTLSQLYGKFDVCYRIGPGVGVSQCLLLWPTHEEGPPEIDFAEDSGHSREWVQSTVHWRTSPGKHKLSGMVVDVDMTEWHVLGVEWSPQLLQFTLDGAVWRTVRGSTVPQVPMKLCLQLETWGAGTNWEAPDPVAGTRVPMKIDWVAAYAHRSKPTVIRSRG